MKRRRRILELLRSSGGPVTGSDLAQRLDVSRQVVVQDVAILRAEGHDILATPQGYVMMAKEARVPHRARIAVKHPPERTQEELNTLVDCGVRVVDVMVEHALYGDLTGTLMLRSREDVARFMSRLDATGSSLLSSLTGGVHLHTVEFERVDDFKKAERLLGEKGLLVDQEE